MGEIVVSIMALILLVGLGIVVKDAGAHADKSSLTKHSGASHKARTGREVISQDLPCSREQAHHHTS